MDFKKLKLPELVTTKTYKDRVVQADADFYCYFVAKLDESVFSNVTHLLNILETNRRMMGAEHLNAHITMGSKGGRHEMATIKPYQDDRDTNPTKDRVREIRSALANWAGTDTTTVIANMITEADDSISTYHTRHNAEFPKGLSIIDSGDKDLNMNQGVHRDSHSRKLVRVIGYGESSVKDVGNKHPKLTGYGDSWFWHQMLMGDPTDDIPGLEVMTGEMLEEYVPLKKPNKNRKNAACGPAKAVAVLSGVKDKSVAGMRVFECYRSFYGPNAVARIIEQAFLLWMRRDDNAWDCIHYLHECGLVVYPTEDQMKRVNDWVKLMEAVHGKGAARAEL